jgi:ketosteroid isomerase-like protein
MSQENVEITSRILKHLRGGEFELDKEGLLAKMADEALLDPEIEWDASEVPVLDIGGVYHGIEGVRQYWRQWFAAWEVVGHFDYRLVDTGNRVVALFDHQRMRGRSTGIEVPIVPYATVMTFRDGRIVHWRFYMSQSNSLKAVGLEE